MRIIERASGWPCLGVVPWIGAASRRPAEDAVAPLAESPGAHPHGGQRLRIAAPLLSRIANFDDADPLRQEPGVDFRFVPPGQPIPRGTDVVILFGTKSTRGDLAFMETQGWHHDIHAHARAGGAVLGLCGGYQLRGRDIDDPDGHDGPAGTVRGLGLLDIDTRMLAAKTLRRLRGRCALSGLAVEGYEIHVGESEGADRARSMLIVDGRAEGARSVDGRIEGSYVHGLFAEDGHRRAWLERHGAPADGGAEGRSSDRAERAHGYRGAVDAALETIADALERALDIERLFGLAESPGRAS